MQLGLAIVFGLLQLCGLLCGLCGRERGLVACCCGGGSVIRFLRACDRGVRGGELLLVGGELSRIGLLLLFGLLERERGSGRVLLGDGVCRREALLGGGDLLRRLLACNLVLLLFLRCQPCLELCEPRLR